MANRPTRSSIFPWLVVGFGFLALALSFSARATLGLVMPSLEQEMGWSRTFLSSAAAAGLVVTAVVAPLIGIVADRQGARTALVAGLAILGLGCLATAASDSPLVFVLAFSGLTALGFGIAAFHVVSTAVAQVFDRNLGLATGFATSGSTAGQFLIVPLIAAVLVAGGWRWSFVAIGLACLALAPLLWRLLPAGRGGVERGGAQSGGQAVLPRRTVRRDLGHVLRKPAFHILFWSFFLCGYTTTGVIETHLLPFASFCGFGPVPSATAYGLLSAVNMLGMILAGWLTDRMNRPLLLGLIYIIRGFSFLILMNIGADYTTLVLFAVLFGVVDYSTVPVTVSLVGSHIGRHVMGLAMGLISAGHAIGGALGAFLGGYLFELYAQYDWVWLSSLGLAVLSGLMVFLLRDRPGAAAPVPSAA